MPIVVGCDHCKKPVLNVVYVLTAVAAVQITNGNQILRGEIYLHWECVPLWDRETGCTATWIRGGELITCSLLPGHDGHHSFNGETPRC